MPFQFGGSSSRLQSFSRTPSAVVLFMLSTGRCLVALQIAAEDWTYHACIIKITMIVGQVPLCCTQGDTEVRHRL
jgi:hypothetical protein